MTFGKRGDAIVCTHLGRPGATVNEVIFTQVDGVYQFLCGERTHQESDGYPVQSAEFFQPSRTWLLSGDWSELHRPAA